MSKIIKIAKSLHTTCPRCGTQIETFDDIGTLKEFATSKYAYPYQRVAGPENTDGKRHIYLFQTVGKNATMIQL